MGHHVPNNPSSEGPLFSSSEYDEIWRVVEEKNAVLLSRIQPSKQSEECRRGVINHVKSLLESQLHCMVFSFGSVPLKTYLPDGDIDLTAIGPPPPFERQHHAWAERVCRVLEREERIHVKEVKCIHAEVPVVKCLVENIIVDITFNQLGGLSTLCFLEEVDKLIGQDHLFKKSIILVKAWCFYESRILGAHHGLLSTYALEVLVLYIFQAYHKSLRGPLQVLYRFLQFFSKFDWEHFCLSPWGPIPLGLLPAISEVPPPNSDGNFLLSDKFLRSCREKYSTHLDNNQGKSFGRKFMNLVDPLRPFNNLGRSVNSGNLVRIYSAFTYGASRLEKLLQSPSEFTSENLALFFRNTQKHSEGQRTDAGFLSFQGDPSCNGNTFTHEFTSGATATSGTFNYMGGLNCRTADGAHADKPTSDDLLCASSQGDSPKESNSDASSEERVVPPIEISRDNDWVSSCGERAEQAVSIESDLRGHMQLECRDTDAAILEGNLELYLDNLNSGWNYQIENAYGDACVNSGAFGRGGLGRSMFMHRSRGRSVPVHNGAPCLPPGAILGSLPKSPKGTGTFFPNLSTTLERDKRVYATSLRSPRRNLDSFNPANHSVVAAFKSRSNVPKRRDGPNKARSRKTIDLKAGENEESSTEATASGGEQSPRVDIGDEFSISMERHMDRDRGAQWLTPVDWSRRSPEAGFDACRRGDKEMSIGHLQFGSFGPGFLATGIHSSSERELNEVASQIQRLSPRDGSLESRDVSPKAGHYADQQHSVYLMKEEDFPPLA